MRGFEPALESDADTGKELNEIEWQKVKFAKSLNTQFKPKTGDIIYHTITQDYLKLDR